MDDLISRQDAIDAARKCSVKEVTPAYMLIDKAEVMTELMMLPSAQPTQPNTPNTLEALDCISRQDAVDIIIGYAEQFNGYIGTPNDSEIYAYARGLLLSIERNISALPSAQPEIEERMSETEQNVPNDDFISRKRAIDALDVLCQEHRYKIPGKRETYSQYNEAWQDALDRAEGAIFNLPSAHPETYKEKLNEIASALSEKFAYMNTCPNERDIIFGYLGVKRCCNTHCNTDCTNTKCESHPLSSAQPEIIRCKDCKYADPFGHCDYVNFWNAINDFCSRAERKENR